MSKPTLTRLAGITPAQLVAFGRGHGWVPINSRGWLTLRRTYVLPTPELVLCTQEEFRKQSFGRWDKPTYQRHEFLNFYFRAADTTAEGRPAHRLRGQVLYRDAVAPWVDLHDCDITQARALEILTAAPPSNALASERAEGEPRSDAA